MSNETKDPTRKALAALFAAITDPDAFLVVEGNLVENPRITSAIETARRVLDGEDEDGFPTVTIVLPLRDARGMRDSLTDVLMFLHGMRVGAGPDAEDAIERPTFHEVRRLKTRLDEAVELVLADFEGPHDPPF